MVDRPSKPSWQIRIWWTVLKRSKLLCAFLQCIPIQALWERYDPTTPNLSSDYPCNIDSYDLVLGAGISHVLIDALIILLPVRYIWQLKMPTTQRLAVHFIFLFGILYVFLPPSHTWVFTGSQGHRCIHRPLSYALNETWSQWCRYYVDHNRQLYREQYWD